MAKYSRGAGTDTEEERENPFEEHDGMSDVTVVVEGKELHVHKTLLVLYSPVFQRMFHSDFSEKNAAKIELPGKNYEDVVNFLIQLYPVHSFEKITDDTLPGILLLAEEYMVEHVRRKCEKFIRTKTKCTTNLSIDQLLLYILLTDRCRFQQLKEKLTEEAEKRAPLEISESCFYGEVDPKLLRDIFFRQSQQTGLHCPCSREMELLKRESLLEEKKSRTDQVQRENESLEFQNYKLREELRSEMKRCCYLRMYAYCTLTVGLGCAVVLFDSWVSRLLQQTYWSFI